jgi:hypothetical protein
MGNLKLISLLCNTQEDYTGSDNPYLRVKGQRVWSGRLRNGQEANLDGVSLIQFGGRARIELWEYDSWDPDDHLGTVYASDFQIGQGDVEGRFSNYGTDYVLTYRVEASQPLAAASRQRPRTATRL